MKNKSSNSNKSFGILFSLLFLIFALYPLVNNEEIRILPFIISIIFLILGLLNSHFLSPLNKFWLKFGFFLGKFMSPIIMLFIFFLIVTPIGLFMRLIGKDLLNLKFKNEKSYWIKKDQYNQNNSMKNQF